MSKKTVWVLTREHNDYDQHGAYFVAAFDGKPNIEKLAKHFSMDGNARCGNVMEAVAFLEHLLKGGGRRGNEEVWHNLEQVELK